jgi:hypothetical protein
MIVEKIKKRARRVKNKTKRKKGLQQKTNRLPLQILPSENRMIVKNKPKRNRQHKTKRANTSRKQPQEKKRPAPRPRALRIFQEIWNPCKLYRRRQKNHPNNRMAHPLTKEKLLLF